MFGLCSMLSQKGILIFRKNSSSMFFCSCFQSTFSLTNVNLLAVLEIYFVKNSNGGVFSGLSFGFVNIDLMVSDGCSTYKKQIKYVFD